MYKIFNKIGLLVFSCIVSFSAFAMDDFPGDVPTDDVETWELATTYRKLCETYNDDTSSVRDLDDAFTEFEEGIFLPTKQNNNPTAFVERARGIRVIA
jgi:hypothetical protein